VAGGGGINQKEKKLSEAVEEAEHGIPSAF
jgi:hypothetical protein